MFSTRRVQTLLLSVVWLGVAGCSETPTGGDPPDATVARGYDVLTAQRLERLATLLGEVTQYVAAREAIHSVLSRSILTENKVTLADFMRSDEGRVVKRILTAENLIRQGEVEALLSLLPPVDFYMPHPQHRRSWTPEKAVAVAALVDEVSTLIAHQPGGGEFVIDRTSYEPTAIPVLLLGPAELKLERPSWQQRGTPSPFIEDWPSEPACEEEEAVDECDGGGGGGGGDPEKTRISSLATQGLWDNGFPWESNEFEAWWLSGPYSGRTWRCTGVPGTGVYDVAAQCGNTTISALSPSEGYPISIVLWETDGWPNPDDEFRDWSSGSPLYANIPVSILTRMAHLFSLP